MWLHVTCICASKCPYGQKFSAIKSTKKSHYANLKTCFVDVCAREPVNYFDNHSIALWRARCSWKSKSTHIHVVHLCWDLKLDRPAKNLARADAIQFNFKGHHRPLCNPTWPCAMCILFIASWWWGLVIKPWHPRGPGVVPAVVPWCNFGAQPSLLTTNTLSASS